MRNFCLVLLFSLVLPTSAMASDKLPVAIPQDVCEHVIADTVAPPYFRMSEVEGQTSVDFTIELVICTPGEYEFAIYVHVPDSQGQTSPVYSTKKTIRRGRRILEITADVEFLPPPTRYMIGWSLHGDFLKGGRPHSEGLSGGVLFQTEDYRDDPK